MSDIKVFYNNDGNTVPSANDPATRQFYSDFLLIDKPLDAFGSLEEVQELPVNGLILHYPMTSIGSSVLNDAVGSAHLNMFNLEVVPGRNGGQALRFNGTDSFCVSSSRVTELEIGEFTLAFWFRTDGMYDESTERGLYGGLVSYGFEGQYYSYGSYYDNVAKISYQAGWCFYNGEDSGCFGFSIGGSLDPYDDEDNPMLWPSYYEDSKWHFAVVSFGEYIKTYMDNVLLLNRQNYWNHFAFNDSNRFFLGSMNNMDTGFYIGDLGEIRFYNRVLSESEIAALYVGT